MMTLPQFYIDDLIKRAITEDINYIDVTTDYLLDDAHTSTAVFSRQGHRRFSRY